MPPLDRMSRRINGWVEVLLFGLGAAMAGIIAVQVFYRYVLNHSLFWSEELARFFLVWLTFLGASVAYYRKAHPGIDVFFSRMPGPLQKFFQLTVHAASIVLFVVMVLYGVEFSYFVRLQISPALHLPKWIIFSVIPVSGIILLVHALSFLLSALKGSARDH